MAPSSLFQREERGQPIFRLYLPPQTQNAIPLPVRKIEIM